MANTGTKASEANERFEASLFESYLVSNKATFRKVTQKGQMATKKWC
jgi:hypothetical protein